jgi:hypothetical protein
MLQLPGSNWRGHKRNVVNEWCNAAIDNAILPANLVTDTCWLLLLAAAPSALSAELHPSPKLRVPFTLHHASNLINATLAYRSIAYL